MVGNIIAAWEACPAELRTAGAQWYPAAYELAADMAATARITTAQAAGIIAALSPSMGWAANVSAAWAVCESHRARVTTPRRHTRVQMTKVRGVLATADEDVIRAILTGPKEHAFYRNIMGDTAIVTVDRWAYRTATGEPLAARSLPPYLYTIVAAAWTIAAERLGVSVRTLQAAVWLFERVQAEARRAVERELKRLAKRLTRLQAEFDRGIARIVRRKRTRRAA